MTDDDKRELFPAGVGRALQRRGRADRGGDAGPGEGGQAAGGVRRPRVEAQAARHRRRRLLGDLPLLPLAAVVDTTKPERASSVHVKQRQQNAHLKTTIIVPVAFVAETRECIAAVHHSERAVCRMQLVDGQTRKISGFHTVPVKMYENEYQPSEKGNKKRYVLSSFLGCLALNFCCGSQQSQL